MSESDQKPDPPEFGYLQSDEPIARSSEDRLDRLRLAEAIAGQAINAPAGQGFVIAIDGPWGSGKTSVLNLIAEVIAESSDAIVLRFNPWLFSGTEQLVVRFLKELSSQIQARAKESSDPALKSKLSEIGTLLSAYGEVLVPLGWIPVAGPWLARIGAVTKALSSSTPKKEQPSVLAQQQFVRDVLSTLGRRIVVFLDDLDRVEPDQTRDVLRLVKLVADFPNVTYVLAYDSEKVAAAIGETVDEGRAYLEKIIQVSHAIPEIGEAPLIRLLQTELDAALQPIEHGQFFEDDWVNIFYSGMKPFFKNVRDVRRYLNTVPVTLRVLGDEVALVDALALETLRIFAPAAYAKLPALVETLTTARSSWNQQNDEKQERAAVQELIAAAAPNSEALEQMIGRLFPAASRYLSGYSTYGNSQRFRRDGRVAHPDVLRLYLQRTLAEGDSPARLVKEAYESMGDAARFKETLDALEPLQVEDLLGRLEDYQDVYDPAAAEAACVVLLNQLPRLREGRRGMFDGGADLAVTRVVLRALLVVTDEAQRTDIVKRVLPQVEQLSGRAELLDVVGRRENPADLMIPQEIATELFARQNEAVLTAEPSKLAEERHLVSLLFRVVRDGGDEARARVAALLGDDRVLLRLLRSSLSERQSQSVGDLAVRSTPDLGWAGIVEMTPGADWLAERVRKVAARVDRASLDGRTALALEVAEKYASGELPEEDPFGRHGPRTN